MKRYDNTALPATVFFKITNQSRIDLLALTTASASDSGRPQLLDVILRIDDHVALLFGFYWDVRCAVYSNPKSAVVRIIMSLV